MLRFTVLVVLLAGLVSACDFFGEPTGGVGATVEGGDIVLLVKLCPEWELETLELAAVGRDITYDEAEIWWKVSRRESGRITRVTTWEVPEGFDEMVRLQQDLMTEEHVGIRVTRSQGDHLLTAALDFRPAMLSEGKVVMRGRTYSMEDFLALACDY